MLVVMTTLAVMLTMQLGEKMLVMLTVPIVTGKELLTMVGNVGGVAENAACGRYIAGGDGEALIVVTVTTLVVMVTKLVVTVTTPPIKTGGNSNNASGDGEHAGSNVDHVRER
jgi:hypothetical protein